MKFYYYFRAPNPRRALIYAAEKGIELELEEVNLRRAEQYKEPFVSINPMSSVPVLRLEDGSYLTETYAIIDYLEATHPDPNMSGQTPLEKARIRELDSLIMFSMLPRVARIFRNESPLFAARTKQFPEIAAMERESLPKVMKVIEAKTENGEFALGDSVSYADCTLYAVAAFAVEAAGLEPLADTPKLADWFARFGKRQSVAYGKQSAE